MKLALAALAVATTVGTGTGIAIAQPVAGCGESFIVLPNGRCMNLSYTSIVAASRRNVQVSNNQYESLLESNAILDVARNMGVTRESEESRKERIQTLGVYRQSRDQVNATGQQIEDVTFPLHLRTLESVCVGFASCDSPRIQSGR